MSKKSNRKTIAELNTRVTQLESAVTKLGIAMKGIGESTRPTVKTSAKAKSPAAPKKTVAKSPTPKKLSPKKTAPTKKATAPTKTAVKTPPKTASGKQLPTLAEALQYVLKHHQDAKSAPVKAAQLYDQVMQAGYRFVGTNRDNNLNYVNKLLRTNKAFTKAGEGGYALA